MSWTLVSDRLHSDPKFRSLSHGAFRLYWVLESYCADYKTNGYVRPADALAKAREHRIKPTAIAELCDVPEGFDHPFLYREKDGLLRFHDDDRFRKKTSTERVRRFRRNHRADATHETRFGVSESVSETLPRADARLDPTLTPVETSSTTSQTSLARQGVTPARCEVLEAAAIAVLQRPLKAPERDVLVELAGVERGGSPVEVDELVAFMNEQMQRETPEGDLPGDLRWLSAKVPTLRRAPNGKARHRSAGSRRADEVDERAAELLGGGL